MHLKQLPSFILFFACISFTILGQVNPVVKVLGQKGDLIPVRPYTNYKVIFNGSSTIMTPINKELLSVSIYPNPAKTTMYIITEPTVDDWQVVNSVGELMFEGCGKKVEVSHLTSGVYYLRVKSQMLRFVKKD